MYGNCAFFVKCGIVHSRGMGSSTTDFLLSHKSYLNDYLYFKANWMISKGFMTICKVMLDVQRTESMNCNRNWKTVQVSMPKIEICPVFIGSFPIY